MRKFAAILFLALSFGAKAQVQITPQDKERASALVKQMTLEEKCRFIAGARSFYTYAIPRLGIPEIRMADGPQGVRNNTVSTLYPCGILTASTWNRDLAHRLGNSLADDCRARGVSILLGPGVNIYRAPMCGRNFEYFGEDPYLSGETAVQYILGVQEKGVMATVKHFAANNQERARHTMSSDVDERTLQEIYFPAFRKAVQEGGVGAVMDSYNLVNSVHSTENAWMNKVVLRYQWGFEGIVMSDWTSVYSTVGAVNGGLDLECPKGVFFTPEKIVPLIENGVLEESLIDELPDDSARLEKMQLDYFRDTYIKLRSNYDFNAYWGMGLGATFHRRSAVEKSGFERHGRPSVYHSFAPMIETTLRPWGWKGPIFTINYEQGIKGIGHANMRYGRLETDAIWLRRFFRLRSLSLRWGGGIYTMKDKDAYFLDFENFREDNMPGGWNDDWTGDFQLLNRDTYNSSDYYVRANLTYESPLMLLSKAPLLGKYVEMERVYVSALVVDGIYPYTEMGYGFTNRLFSIGIFVATRNIEYDGIGCRIGLELFRDW